MINESRGALSVPSVESLTDEEDLSDKPCAPTGLFGLSDAAKQAVSWLYSEQARNLSVMEARAAILEGFGVAVDRELRSIFAKMDEEGPQLRHDNLAEHRASDNPGR